MASFWQGGRTLGGGGGPQGRPPQAAVGGRRPPNPGEAGVPCGPEPAGCTNRQEAEKATL